jgi:hypothetical protein
MTLYVTARSDGMTTVARTARIAAGTDQEGFHHGCGMIASLENRGGR